MTQLHSGLAVLSSTLALIAAGAWVSTVSGQSPGAQGAPDPAFTAPEARDAIEEFRSAHGGFVKRAVFVPPVLLSGSWMPSAQIGSEPGHFDMWEVELDATIPLPIDRDSFLIFGLEAGIMDIDFTNVQTVANETLYRLGPKLGYGKFLTDDFVIQAYWQPSIYTDWGGSLKSEDFRPEYGTALAVYRESKDLFWKVGFKITDAVDSGVIPLGGLMWHFRPSWMLDILAPRHAQVRCRVDDKWTMSGGFRVRADEYRIRGPVSVGQPRHDVHVQEVLLTVASEYRLSDNLSSQLTVGMTVAGEWDWGYGNGQPKFDGTLDPGLFLEWGLGWRF